MAHFMDNETPQLVLIRGIGVLHWREWMIHYRCTCSGCPFKDKCPYAYDLYNKDGDCLMMK